jgi:hypothetical protein
VAPRPNPWQELKRCSNRTWVCLPHAEEILVTMPAAFIASHDGRGIAEFRASHQLPARRH